MKQQSAAQKDQATAPQRDLGGDHDGALDPNRAPWKPVDAKGKTTLESAADFGKDVAKKATGGLPDVKVDLIDEIEDLGLVDFDQVTPKLESINPGLPIEVALDLTGSVVIKPKDPLAVRLMAADGVDMQAYAATVLDEGNAAISMRNIRGVLDGTTEPSVTLMGTTVGGTVAVSAKPAVGPGGVGMSISYSAPKQKVEFDIGESFKAVGEIGWSLKLTVKSKPPQHPIPVPKSLPDLSWILDAIPPAPVATAITLLLGTALVIASAPMTIPAAAAGLVTGQAEKAPPVDTSPFGPNGA
jgi:hypothetical protein